MNGNLIIENIDEIVTPEGNCGVSGSDMQNLRRYEHYSVVVEDGKIAAITKEAAALAAFKEKGHPVLSGKGKTMTPGYVDSHTHLIFGGYRPEEFDMRLKGVAYMEIMKKGGGIANTVKMTQEATLDHLIATGAARLTKMLAMGTTTVEAKSGYGMTLETEMKQLKAVKALKRISPVTLVSTFLGAHAIPEDYQHAADFVNYLNERVLPLVKDEALAEFVDIFCEDHVFNIEDSRMHLQAAKALGFKLKLHADEIVPLGGAELAAEMGAVSADHLLHVSDEGIQSLIKANVVATLLPATAFTLREQYAPARRLIDGGCMVALATDFNPGSCFSYSMPLVIALATLQMKMTIEEVITALTLNAAAALNRAEIIGSVEVGKQADLLLHDFPSYKYIPYHVGINTVAHTIKKGVVYTNNIINRETFC
ncbi:imidazolonepropionase [Fusibacter paucivorans]|uniref:Imidazolonepropionase n=1 Tax=Fusibacter paucivorans TaxID=76009 RepID=A0ABS5PTJ0_9FIRM|nr:imidazolonepropionase [Fusibacter paucivorans]MBS7527357.1 imidazolonepropionase [Fusibacter paucivorans]